MSNQQPTRSRRTIPLMEYESPRHLLIPEVANQLIKAVNALLKLEIVDGRANEIVVSDDKFTIVTKRSDFSNDASEIQNWFPFRVYTFPPAQRASPDNDVDWRKFRVRHGVVFGDERYPVDPTGTDGAAIPDDFRISEGDMADIVVAAGTERYWFWLDIDEVAGTAEVMHGDIPPAAWSLTVIPIAEVDTASYVDTQRAPVRQYLRTDVIIPCLDFPTPP